MHRTPTGSYLSSILDRSLQLYASATRIRITFVSSICAVGNWPRERPTQPVIPEEIVRDSRSAMEHGYGESKCVAEQILP